MKPHHFVATVLNWSVVAALAYIGIDFLTTKQPMPHHQRILDVPFMELTERTRILMMTLLKGTGLVAVVGAVAIGVLLAVPFRRREPWVRWGLLIIGGTVLIPPLIGTFAVRAETGAPAPWWPHVAMLGAMSAAWWLTRDFQTTLPQRDLSS